MKDTYYFSHDYNSRLDEKIKKLLSKHGYLGYGLFWALIEDLYNNTNVLRLDYETIAFDLRCELYVIKSIINDFDLFIIDGENFGSLSVQKRLNERKEISNKARASVLKRWANKGVDTVVLQSNNDSNTRKEKERKINENKEKYILLEKETKDIFSFKKSLIDFGFNKKLVEEWLKVRKTKKATNTETAFNKFIEQVRLTPCEISIDNVLEVCIEKSWSGFKAEWLENLNNKNNGKQSTEQAVREF